MKLFNIIWKERISWNLWISVDKSIRIYMSRPPHTLLDDFLQFITYISLLYSCITRLRLWWIILKDNITTIQRISTVYNMTFFSFFLSFRSQDRVSLPWMILWSFIMWLWKSNTTGFTKDHLRTVSLTMKAKLEKLLYSVWLNIDGK